MSSPRTVVFVLGGTGNTGKSIVDGLLQDQSFHVIVGSRPQSVQKPANKALEALGVEIRAIDTVNDKHSTLKETLAGVHVLISAGAYQVLDEQSRVFDAAKEAGVQRVVPNDWATYTPGPGIRAMYDQKLAVREHVKLLGLTYTFIDVGWWMQVVLPQPSSSNDPYAKFWWETAEPGNVKSAMTSLPKIGEYVAQIIKDPRTENQAVFIWEAEFTMNELWDLAERVSGAGSALAAQRIRLSEDEVARRIAGYKADIEKSGSIEAKLGLAAEEYRNSAWIRGDNTVANAKAGGVLDARQLYPDIQVTSLESVAQDFYIKGVSITQGAWDS